MLVKFFLDILKFSSDFVILNYCIFYLFIEKRDRE